MAYSISSNTLTIIDMLAPNGDLDQLCRLRNIFRTLNKLDIPFIKSETVIHREGYNGKRYPVYLHTKSKFN